MTVSKSAEAPSSLRTQFAIFDRARAPRLPALARIIALNTLDIADYGDLCVTRVVDARGILVGALIGRPLDMDACSMVAGTLVLSRELPASVIDADARSVGARAPTALDDVVTFAPRITTPDALDTLVEEEIFRLGGLFLFVLDCCAQRRIYLDACGSLPLVYDPAGEVAASSAGALLDRESYASRFDYALFDRLGIAGSGWAPSGLTAHRGVRRLLVNHYLDLNCWSQVRHWPVAPVVESSDPGEAIRAVTHAARAGIDALRATGPIALALTAGSETRLLLAACRDIAADLEFVTIDAADIKLDVTRAADLAARFGLRHTRLPAIEATDAQLREWVAQTGHCASGAASRLFPSLTPLVGRVSCLVGGLGGEIGRGFFWRRTDRADTSITTATLIARMGLAPDEALERATEAWLRALLPCDAFLTLDLAYIELRMGPWAYASAYTSPDLIHVHPLVSRRSFAAMLALPPDFRSSNRLITDGIYLLWPDLLSVPINSYGDYRDILEKIKKVIRNPRIVINFLRKRFGGERIF